MEAHHLIPMSKQGKSLSLGQKDFDFRNSLLEIFKIDRLNKKANKKSILSVRKTFLFAFYI